jgi:hypothetical protein
VTRRNVDSRAALDVTLGQIGFAVFLAVCVALHPGLVLKANEGGMSNYGVHAKTVVPFTLALGLPSAFTYAAARRLHAASAEANRFRTLLHVYSGLLALTLLSTYPYTLDRALTDLHIAVGICLTVFESVASVWMYRELRRYELVLAAQLVGLVLAGLTFIGALHLLFATEVLSGAAYAYLLVRTTQRWS